MKGSRWFVTACLLAVLAVLVSPPAAEAFLPEAISETARQIDQIFYWVLGLTVFIFILTQGLLLYAVFRWRRRAQDERAATFSEHVPLEVFWTAVPTVIVIVLAVVSWQVLADVWDHPADAMVIEVTGHQWLWEFHYPDYDFSTEDELVVPVDQPVRLLLTSNDVIHSLWVPELRVKQDVEPGRVTEMSFTADTTGVFRVPCTEYCGIGHGEMVGTLRVLSEADYQAWLEEMGQIVDDEPPDDADVYVDVHLLETPGESPGDWSIDPFELEVTQGQKVAVQVINGGTQAPHNLVIEDPVGVRSRTVHPGESTWVSFTVDEAGQFDMWCDIPGHRALGMFGTLTVTPN